VVAALAALLALVSGGCALSALGKLPSAKRDCDRYGRHMLGLSYILVVLGLCNAIGTSVLALDGWLTVSVATVMESANPKRAREADERKAGLETKLHDLSAAQRTVARRWIQLNEDVKACRSESRTEPPALPPGASSSPAAASIPTVPSAAPVVVAAESAAVEKDACVVPIERVRSQRNLFDDQCDQISDLNEELELADERCQKARGDSQLALFFLLSLSAMMSLLGACFYVVNSLRLKRLAPDDEAPPGTQGTADVQATDGASVVNQISTEQEVVSTRVEVEVPKSGGSAPASPHVTAATLVTKPSEKGETFDEHAFWSGAFFRVGEAVLFTFAFFWLMWTSAESSNIAWLPVLALFIGMFVKTGETLVFRLGMRALAAAEAMLPAPGGSAGGASVSSQTTTPNGTGKPGAPPVAGANPEVPRPNEGNKPSD
jgi:hypothetical protein